MTEIFPSTAYQPLPNHGAKGTCEVMIGFRVPKLCTACVARKQAANPPNDPATWPAILMGCLLHALGRGREIINPVDERGRAVSAERGVQSAECID